MKLKSTKQTTSKFSKKYFFIKSKNKLSKKSNVLEQRKIISHILISQSSFLM